MKFSHMEKIDKKNTIITFFVIVAITFGIYSNGLRNEFIDYWDDNTYITGNDLVKSLGFSNLKSIFSTIFWTDYYPVSLLTYAIDYHFWELNPLGYHITNVFIHSMNAFLIFLIIIELTGMAMTAYITAVIFIIHPVNVETVAWISERKNLLSFLFLLISFYLYIRSDRKKQIFFYIASILAYVIALLSKSMVVIFPLILLLYDFSFTKKSFKLKIIDKIPFFILSITFSVITVIAFRGSPAFTLYNENLFCRILSMLRIFTTYAGKIFVPVSLNNFYVNYMSFSIFDREVLISIFILMLISYFAYKSYKKDRKIFFCVLWFFLYLLPVSNIIPVSHWMADRYLYYSSFGYSLFLAFMITGDQRNGLPETVFFKLRKFAIPILVVIIGLYSYQTISRNSVWKNSITLWEDCVKKDDRGALAHSYLGGSYMKRGFREKAYVECVKALRINPHRANALANLAYLDMENGLMDNALKKIKLAFSYEGDNYEAHMALGIFYMHKNKFDKAVFEFKMAVEGIPESILDLILIHNNLGVAYYKIKRFGNSIESFKEVLKFDPESFEANISLATIYSLNMNSKNDSLKYLNAAEKIRPADPMVRQLREKLIQM